MVAIFLHIVRSLNMDVITHYFLEKDHTQNEGPSVQSDIECATKRTNIYKPSQWYTLIALAKRENEPYRVVEMEGCMINLFAITIALLYVKIQMVKQ